MCQACWRGYGSHQRVTPEIIAMAARIKAANPFGGLHIVIDDWNLEDDHLTWCRDEWERTTDEEKVLATDMLAMTFEDRVSAMALADGFFTPPAL